MARRNLSLNNIPAWPLNLQIGFASLVAFFILLLAYLFLFRGQREELAGLESKENELRTQVEQKAGKAANLPKLKQQLVAMESDLQQMLRQLPSRTEMPDIITDLSQAALGSGLRVEMFKPLPEVPKEIYAEQPIDLRFSGGFHQFGAFMSSVASLPRVVIMTMNNIALTPKGKNEGLELAGTVKTYRYLDESEKQPDPKAKGGKPGATPENKPAEGAK